MNEPKKKPVEAKVVSEATRPGPPAFFANKDRVARWSLAALCLSGLGHLLELAMIFHLVAQPPYFNTMDPEGNNHGGRGKTLDQAKQVQVQQSILAAYALLERSQSDFDMPELLQCMFTRPALDAAMALRTAEATEFHDKAISQKVLPGRIEALDTRPDKVLVAITGKLVRDGLLQQQPFREVVPFKLLLMFQLNPDYLRAQQQPVLVVDFKLSYEPAN